MFVREDHCLSIAWTAQLPVQESNPKGVRNRMRKLCLCSCAPALRPAFFAFMQQCLRPRLDPTTTPLGIDVKHLRFGCFVWHTQRHTHFLYRKALPCSTFQLAKAWNGLGLELGLGRWSLQGILAWQQHVAACFNAIDHCIAGRLMPICKSQWKSVLASLFLWYSRLI